MMLVKKFTISGPFYVVVAAFVVENDWLRSTYKGCWQENARQRHFHVTMGKYNPTRITTTLCQEGCTDLLFSFAALTQGKFCFCSNILPARKQEKGDTKCNKPCVGDKLKKCGGDGYVSVYGSVLPLKGLELTTDAGHGKPQGTGVPAAVSLIAKITSGSSVEYEFDFGIGEGFTEAQDNDKRKYFYLLPGTYQTFATAAKKSGGTKLKSSVAVVLDEKPADVEVVCDKVFNGNVEGQCQITIWRGSNLRVKAEVDRDNLFTMLPQIADPRMELHGYQPASSFGIPSVKTITEQAPSTALLFRTRMEGDGKLYAIKSHVKKKGELIFLVLSPVCATSEYCLSSNKCEVSTCASKRTTVTRTCSAGKFYIQTSQCNAKKATMGKMTVDDFKVKYVYRLNVDGNIGLTITALKNPFDVSFGDILGLKIVTGNGEVSTHDTNDDGDVVVPDVDATPGTVMKIGNNKRNSGLYHRVQGLVSYGSKVVLKYTFEGEGGKVPMKVTVTNDKNVGQPVVENTELYIAGGIKIIGPEQVATGKEVVYKAGNSAEIGATYNWTVVGETQQPSETHTIKYTFHSKGTFTLRATKFNQFGSDTAELKITVRDKVTTRDDPEPITNLRLVETRSYALDNIFLKWKVDTGDFIEFTFKFDDGFITVDDDNSDPQGYYWQSVKMPGLEEKNYLYELTAMNNAGEVTITGTFVVMDAVINPQIFADLYKVGRNMPVTFTVTMDRGSGVFIEIDFGDGSPLETYSSTFPGNPWNSPWSFEHSFENGCNCQVTASFFNAAGSHKKSIEIFVSEGIDNFNWTFPSEKYYLYNPPAIIDFGITLNSSWPADPTFSLDWGDGSVIEVANTAVLSPQEYKWQFDDTGVHMVKLEISEFGVKKTFYHKAIVIEKLVGPEISLEFPSAPLNLPFNISFSLFRGDRGNLTMLSWDFGDGKPPTVTEREAVGEYGLDTLPVTYTSSGAKTVTVTATAPLDQEVSASKTFNVINGVDPDAVEVTSNGDIKFGEASKFTIKYKATPLPDEAKIKVDWYGDGSKLSDAVDFTISSVGGTQIITINYPKDGLHKAKVIIYNDASNVAVETESGVYQAFSNLKIEASYIPDTDEIPPPHKLGLMNKQNYFPLDKPVHFKLTDDNNAFASAYDVESTESVSAEDVSGTFTNNGFGLNFTMEGKYTLKITARNPLNTAHVTKSVTMVKRVIHMHISEEKFQVAPGENKNFNFTFGNYGNDTCVYIDWGDLHAKSKFGNNLDQCNEKGYEDATKGGNMVSLTVDYIGHNYLREGSYVMNATAVSYYGSEKIQIDFSVAYKDCSTPRVLIHNQVKSKYRAKKIKRNEIVRFLGLADINCPHSFANQKQWILEKIQELSGEFQTMNLTELVDNKAELYIPARYLDLGTYKATYRMMMGAGDHGIDYSASTYTYFKLVQSDLMGIMAEGGLTDLMLGTEQTLTLEPLKWSYDPDMEPSAVSKGLSVSQWECKVIDSNDQSPCDSVDKSAVATQTIDGSKWQDGSRFLLTAHLSKDVRTTKPQLTIWINGTNPRRAFIKCLKGSVCIQMADGYLGLESSRMSLDCECHDCSPEALYKWEVYVADYRWPGRWRPIRESHLFSKSISADAQRCNYSDPACHNGVYSKALSLQDDLFYAYENAGSKYKAQCVIVDEGSTTKVATNIRLNYPPKGGKCYIKPKVANATVDCEKKWEVTCWDWKDEEGIKGYQISSYFAENEVEKEVTSYPTSLGGIFLKVALPAGPKYRNYQQDVYVYVRDKLNAVTKFKVGTVTVYPPDESSVKNYVDSIISGNNKDFLKVMHEGDQRAVSEMATALAASLGSSQSENEAKFAGQSIVAGSWVNTGYAPGNRTGAFQKPSTNITYEEQYAYEKLRDDRAQVRSQLTDFILDMSMDDIISIQQVSGALAEIASKPTELTHETQKKILRGIDKMLDNLADPVKMKSVPQEEIQKAMANLQSALGGVIDAAGTYGNFPTLNDMTISQGDDSWKKYETSNTALDGETDLMEAKSYEDAMRQHTLDVHKKLADEETMEIRNMTNYVVKKMANLFQRFAIPGQVQETTGYRSRFRLEKNYANSYMDKTITLDGSDASVTLPNENLFPGTGPNDVITLQVMQETNTENRYSDKASKYFPKDSHTHFVSMEFYNKSGERMPSSPTMYPVKLVIPNDPNAPKPKKHVINPLVPSWNRFMLHTTTTPHADATVQAKLEIERGRQFLVIVKHEGLPEPSYNSTDFIFVVPKTIPPDPETPNPYSVFINKELAAGRSGRWTFGVIERNRYYKNKPPPTNEELVERYEKGSGEFSTYNITFLLSGCYFQLLEEEWDTEGCEVSEETTLEATVCLCKQNGGAKVGGGLIVIPNTIDWNHVFSNMDFLSNPTIYITQIVIVLFFLVAFIMARRKDLYDTALRGLTPLADNKVEDKYFYEVLVSTGWRRSASTDSKVFVILSGEKEETEVRLLSDSKRKLFRRGATNGFLMAVPRSLGNIHYIRVWHDNSGGGKFGSWFLNYMTVRDLQTDATQMFINNKWLAVEEGDGQVDRIIPHVGKEQLSNFSYRFSERAKRNLLDDHLWFSLVARPPTSRFTCVQRVACCLCLLYMTMVTNAMYYNNQEDVSMSASFDVGPFSMSLSQLSVGFLCTVIVFPVNFLMVFMFRRSKYRQVSEKKSPEFDRMGLVHPELQSVYVSTVDQDIIGKKKKTPFALPWWCMFIAWILLTLLTLSSAAFVTFYGISFGDKTCKKWITSLIMSFFTSVFVTQPLKVILFAMFLSLIIRNPAEDDDEQKEDSDDVVIDERKEDFLHPGAQDMMEPGEMNQLPKRPPSQKKLERMRKQRLNEIKMWAIMREIFFYIIFLWILIVIAHRYRSADNFHYKNSMYRTFISSLDTKISFEKIQTKEDFWLWAKSGLIGGLLAGSYYNNYPPLRLRTYINDKASRILGHAVLRQNRVKPHSCKVSGHFMNIVPECNMAYKMDGEEKGDFDLGWAPRGSISNHTSPEYKYTSAQELNGFPYWGVKGIYSGGGYVARLIGSKKSLLSLMTRLEKEGWIDRYTRSVFVEFTVYNPQVNLFSMNMLLAEFDTTNGIITSHRFEPAMLLPYNANTLVFQLFCEISFSIYLLVFLFMEIKKFYQLRLRYFTHFWNWVELCILILSIVGTMIYVYRLFETDRLTQQFKKSQGNGYIKFQYVSYWNEIFSYIIGFIVFFATLKFLKLLRFNKRVSMLSDTIRYSRKNLLHFGVVALLIFLAFCQLFFLTFMNVDETYSSFIESVVASVLMMMGKFNIYVMIMAEPVLTQVFVFAFVVVMTFIIVNMFVSILNDTFSEVLMSINKQSNEFEIIDFILGRFKNFIGIGGSDKKSSRKSKKKSKSSVQKVHFAKDENASLSLKDQINAPYKNSKDVMMFSGRIELLLQRLSVATVMNNSYEFRKDWLQSDNDSPERQRPGGYTDPETIKLYEHYLNSGYSFPDDM